MFKLPHRPLTQIEKNEILQWHMKMRMEKRMKQRKQLFDESKLQKFKNKKTSELPYPLRQSLLSLRQKRLRRYMTAAERRILSLFRTNHVKVIPQKGFMTNNAFFIVDFYIPRRRIVIEIDGSVHDNPQQKSRDAWKDLFLKKEKHIRKIIRISNSRAFSIMPTELMALINST